MSAVLGLRPADITWYCTPARILLLSWSTWCFLLPSCPLPSLSPSSVPPLFPTLCTPPCSALPCLPSIPPLPLLSLPLPCHLYSPPSPSLSSLSRLKKNWTSPLTQHFFFLFVYQLCAESQTLISARSFTGNWKIPALKLEKLWGTVSPSLTLRWVFLLSTLTFLPVYLHSPLLSFPLPPFPSPLSPFLPHCIHSNRGIKWCHRATLEVRND